MTGLVTDGGRVGEVLTKKTDNYAGQPETDYDWAAAPSGIGDVPLHPVAVWGRTPGRWVEVKANIDVGIGLQWSQIEDNVIDLIPPVMGDATAGTTPVIGGVYTTPRSDRNAIVIDTNGHINVPLATDQLAGSLIEPPNDGVSYARSRAGGTSRWVPTSSDLVFKEGLTQTGNEVNVTPATAIEIGGVIRVPRTAFQAVDIAVDGKITVQLATKDEAGAITEPELPGVNYAREVDATTGVGKWIPIFPPEETIIPGIGLEWNATNKTTIDLQEATLGGEIGGIRTTARSLRNGLDLDTNGYLTAPIATNAHAGSIVEPPNDDKSYMRMRSANGVSAWVEPSSSTNGFVWQTPWAPLGDEIIDTVPQYTFTIPKSDLPNTAIDFIVMGMGSGHFFVHNSGKGAQAVTNGGGTWTVSIEYPAGSGVHYDVATIPFGDATFPDATARIVRANPGNEYDVVFRYDPATDIGIVFGVRLTGGENIGNPWDVILGIEGRILGSPSSTGVGLPEAPVDNSLYARRNASWESFAPGAMTGDVKSSFLTTDHSGWIKLDGRLITTLTVTQQNAAQGLGFNTNLPDATNSVALQNGGVPGAISGSMSKTIAQANLPNVTLTAASSGAHTHTTDNVGGHDHPGERSVYAQVASSVEVAYDRNEPTETRGAHSHVIASAGAHTHTVSLGGSGTALDITPKAMAVNMFVFLGAQVMTGLVADGGLIGQVLTKKTDRYDGSPEIDYEWADTLQGDFVKRAGDSMIGPLTLVITDPTIPEEATHKRYVDESISAQSLYQGVWLPATNVPDLTPGVANPLHSYSWIAQVTDVTGIEVPPAGIPGLSGVNISSADTIIWNNNLQTYEIVRSPAAASGFLPLAGGTLTGALGTVGVTNSAAEISSSAHIRVTGGAAFAFNQVVNGNWENFLYAGGIMLQSKKGGNNDGQFRLWTMNGGYTDTWVFESTVVSGYPGINVNGNVVARQLINRDGTHIRCAQVEGYGIEFFGGAILYKRSGHSLVFRKQASNTPIRIENNDGSNIVNIATTAMTTTLTVEELIAEQIAPLLNRIVQLEQEISTLRKSSPRSKK